MFPLFFTCADVTANNIMITPEGGLEWCKALGQPRGYQGSDDDREWSSILVLPQESAEMLISILREEYMEYHGKKKPAQYGLPWKKHTDADGNETGKTSFSFKRKEFAYNNEPNTPPLVVDASGTNKWPASKLIGNGSTGKVRFHSYPWSGKSGCGMTLELRAIQVLQHKAYEKDEPAFGVVEGGFVLDADEIAAEATTEACGFTPPASAGACDFQSQVSAAVAAADDDMPF